MFIAPVLLTENDVPEASLHGKKAYKDCRVDLCKGMTVKAQLAKRYVCI